MKQLDEFEIQFSGLKDGKHQFDYHIDRKFFDTYNFDEYEETSLDVVVSLTKKPTLMEFEFSTKGYITVPCDVMGELFNLDIEGCFSLIVNFGEEYNDDNPEILILSNEMYKLNVGQYIYELIVLSVPSKRVHPDVLNGSMQNKALEKLRGIEYKEDIVEKADPRWDKLKDLLTGKKE